MSQQLVRGLLVALLSLAFCNTGAMASSLHTCPTTGSTSSALIATEPVDGGSSWKLHLPQGELEMFVSGTTLFCKYEGGTLITKEVGSGCALSARGGKITTPPRSEEYCTFRDSSALNKMDCFLACP